MSHSPSEIAQLLCEEGVLEVQQYLELLQSRLQDAEGYRDLLAEGYAALALARARFTATMRDSPDLRLELGSSAIGAEVKRFRRKQQDDTDDRMMEQADDLLVQYGSTLQSEGREAWDQVEDVLAKKCSQLWAGIPNVVVILSSSPNCVEDIDVMSAVDSISRRQTLGEPGNLGKLNGVMLLSPEYSISRRRNVYFFECGNPDVPLPRSVKEALAGITEWKTD